MKKNEKLNEKESFALGVYIAGLYEKCQKTEPDLQKKKLV